MGPRPIFFAVATALSLLGCGITGGDRVDELARNAQPVGPEIQVGTGDSLRGPWTAVIYRMRDQQVCLMVRFGMDQSGQDGTCWPGAIDGPMMTSDDVVTFVLGATSDSHAVSARVNVSDGPFIPLDLVLPAPGVTDGVRYYATSLPGRAKVQTVDVLSDAGIVLDSKSIAP